MPSPLAIVRRIAAMSADEIATRAAMVVRQRLDALAVARGKNPLRARYSESADLRPRFFFDESAAALTAAEVLRRLPSECAGVIESARRVQSHRFDLLGYRGLSFGDGKIDWHRDPVHGITPPYEPWFRVPYLDFSKTGDHKIVWELSRHQHLMLLARAWLYTGDGQFLVTVQDLWTGWRTANPYPMGINWASSLEVAFRCLSWIWVDHLSAGAGDLQGFRASLREAIGECAVYIERYISTYFAPNTHLLGEALALFFVGVVYPGFERAPVWREYGWKVLLQESSRQVREDGFHFEQSVYYHVYALDMFLHARILAARNSIAIPESYDRTLILMADGLAAIGAGGQPPRFGDDDGGRLFDGRRNAPAHMLDPLAAAAIIYGRGDWKTLSGGVREETIWILGAGGGQEFDRLPAGTHAGRSEAFTASGYYAIASANAVAVIDAGPHGWGRGGHGHADALSIQLIGGGRAWLTDPGTGSYPQEKPERDHFRGTAAHNTMEVDGLSQAEPIHSFAWRVHPVTTVHAWYSGPEIALFHGSHDGYTRLQPPVIHDRWVIGWNDDVWLIIDRARGEGAHHLDLRWHLSPDCIVSTEYGNVWRASFGQETLEIIAAPNNRWSATCEKGSFSPAYGAAISSSVLHLSHQGRLPVDCATILSLNNPGHSSLRSARVAGADIYLSVLGEARRLVVIANTPGVWRFGAIESDAEFLLIAVDCVLITGGTQVRIAGESLVMERITAEVSKGLVSASVARQVVEYLSGPGSAL